MVECKYRGRVIGWLVTGEDGEMRYRKVDSPFGLAFKAIRRLQGIGSGKLRTWEWKTT